MSKKIIVYMVLGVLLVFSISGCQIIGEAYFPADVDRTCVDSDGGQNYFEKGFVSYYAIEDRETIEDFCMSIKRVYEFYCEGENLKGIDYICAEGCGEGKCIEG